MSDGSGRVRRIMSDPARAPAPSTETTSEEAAATVTDAPEFAVGHVPSWTEARRLQRQRLSRIRRLVQRGEYENPLKISVAADRLLEKLLEEN